MDDLVDDHKDAKADYEASKKEVAAYEKMYKENNLEMGMMYLESGHVEIKSVMDTIEEFNF